MLFELGDRVHITVDAEFADGKVISAGTCGNVVDIYEIFQAYLVKFKGVGLPRMIAETDLAEGCNTD